MEKRNVAGIPQLSFAVVTKQDVAISVHQHPDAAERSRKALPYPDEFEVVELLDPIGYRQH